MGTLLLLLPLVLSAAAQAPPSQPVAVRVLFGAPDETALNEGRVVPGGPVVAIPVQTYVSLPPLSYCLDMLEVTYQVAAPPYANVSIDPARESKPAQDSSELPGPGYPVTPHQAEVAFQSTLQVSTREEAPGLEHTVYEVTALVRAGPSLTCSLEGAIGRGSFSLSNDYFPAFHATADQAPDGGIIVHVKNQANGPSGFTFDASEPIGGWVRASPLLFLESQATQGPSADTAGSVVIPAFEVPPGWTGHVRVTERLAPFSDDPSLAEETQVVPVALLYPLGREGDLATLDEDGSPSATPVGPAWLALAVLAGSAALTRRRPRT